MPSGVTLGVTTGPSKPRHALLAGLGLLRCSVVESAQLDQRLGVVVGDTKRTNPDQLEALFVLSGPCVPDGHFGARSAAENKGFLGSLWHMEDIAHDRHESQPATSYNQARLL